jgi:hypothetical protein
MFSSWVGVLLVFVGMFFVWLVVRAVIDLVRWVREEVIGADYRARRKKRRRRQ